MVDTIEFQEARNLYRSANPVRELPPIGRNLATVLITAIVHYMLWLDFFYKYLIVCKKIGVVTI